MLDLTISTIESISNLLSNALDGGLSLLILLVCGFIGYLVIKQILSLVCIKKK